MCSSFGPVVAGRSGLAVPQGHAWPGSAVEVTVSVGTGIASDSQETKSVKESARQDAPLRWSCVSGSKCQLELGTSGRLEPGGRTSISLRPVPTLAELEGALTRSLTRQLLKAGPAPAAANLIAPKPMFCFLFFLAWLSVNLGQASTPPIRWSILNSLGLLNIRGGAPDLSSGAKRELWLGEDLSVGVRDGKFSIMTPKQKAELMIMGSNPTESRSILQVESVRNEVLVPSRLTTSDEQCEPSTRHTDTLHHTRSRSASASPVAFPPHILLEDRKAPATSVPTPTPSPAPAPATKAILATGARGRAHSLQHVGEFTARILYRLHRIAARGGSAQEGCVSTA